MAPAAMNVVVFGATGVVGRAVVEDAAARRDREVVGVSRRSMDVEGATHVSCDLTDGDAAREILTGRAFAGTTHVVYAALQESSDLVSGWRDGDLMARNQRMFRHALEPLVAAHGSSLQHVTLLQGAKAYGVHVGRMPVPAKERAPRDDHANFYFLQEDALRSTAEGSAWSWTILRPQVVYGESVGSPMNLIPAIGVYAAVERARGRPLSFPGGARAVHEAVDARLLARAVSWAGTAEAAQGEIFNITNGDVFDWHQVWPTIADALGMVPGEPEARRLAVVMPPRSEEWAAVADRHQLVAPRDMAAFVGGSWIYADILFGALGPPRPLPALLSTVKIRQAGFADCVDTDDMFRELLARMQERRLLPPP